MKAKPSVSVNAGFFPYCALLMLLLPLRWVFGIMLAALIHECCHILAIKLCRVELQQVTLGAFGAKLHTGPMTYRQELLCALCGPVGGLTMLLFRMWLPVTAFCCTVQSLFNLLPLYPADGGRALRCFLLLHMPHNRAVKYSAGFDGILRVGIVLLCLYAVCIFELNISVFLVALVFCLVKFPCKAGKYKVQ